MKTIITSILALVIVFCLCMSVISTGLLWFVYFIPMVASIFALVDMHTDNFKRFIHE